MYYKIQVALDIRFKQIVVNKIVASVNEYHLQKDLDYFTVYYWRVKSINEINGQESAWSIPCMFRIKAKDVTVQHDISNPFALNSYIMYGSEIFGFKHRFVRSYDSDCITPEAYIGVGLCPTSAIAQIGVCFCPGDCVSAWDEYVVEYLLNEDGTYLLTEDGEYFSL